MMLLTAFLLVATICISIPHPGLGQEFQLLLFGGFVYPQNKVYFFPTLDGSSCELQPLPEYAHSKPSGGFMEKHLTICGGGLRSCYHPSVQSGELQWLEQLDFDGPYDSILTTTYDFIDWTFFGHRYDKNTFFTWKTGNNTFIQKDLPFELKYGACSARKNQTHAIVAQGAQLVHWYEEEGQSFEKWHELSGSKKIFGEACGTVYNPDREYQFVSTGGFWERDDGRVFSTISQLFDFSTNKWTEGERLPYGRAKATSVPFQKEFLIVGGLDESGNCNTIIKYDNENGFIDLNIQLQRGDRNVGAMRVPRDMFECP